MKTFYLKIIIYSFLFFSIFSCTINNNTLSTNTTSPVDVYVAGIKGNNACYWKNNQLTILNSAGYTNIRIQKIMVSNGNVYVLGYSLDSNANYQYLYWKNGVLTNLNNFFSNPNNINDILYRINDMYIDGNDVYFCGTRQIWPSNQFSSFLCINGTSTPITSGSYYKIMVKNNIIYAVGNGFVNQQQKEGYYINSQFFPLSNNGNLGLASITFLNNDIFVCGGIQITPTSNYIGYYKNISTGAETTLPNIGVIYNLVSDSGNLYYVNASGVYCNNILLNNTHHGVSLIDYYVKNNNLYTISNSDLGGTNLPCFLDVNGVTTMNSLSGERFDALFIN